LSAEAIVFLCVLCILAVALIILVAPSL